MSTDMLTRPDVEAPVLSDQEPGAVAHIVMDTDRERDDPRAYLMEAMVEGFPVEALCGYVWTPHRNAKTLPVCSPCKAIYENDPLGHGDRGDLPDA